VAAEAKRASSAASPKSAPAPKSAAKLATKTASAPRSAAKPAPAKPTARPGPKTAAKPTAKPAPAKPTAKSGPRVAAKPAPAAKPAAKPGPKTAAKPAPKPAAQPAPAWPPTVPVVRRKFKRHEIALGDGGKLVLETDGSIVRLDAAAEATQTWQPEDPDWARHALRFGVRPQAPTVRPDPRDQWR
jgi:hypothetical protein